MLVGLEFQNSVIYIQFDLSTKSGEFIYMINPRYVDHF
jgi:hypothetical protein